ncbi:hypothetical protein BDZ89DRAFT_1051811, partial [Hymenopellis radicata]
MTLTAGLSSSPSLPHRRLVNVTSSSCPPRWTSTTTAVDSRVLDLAHWLARPRRMTDGIREVTISSSSLTRLPSVSLLVLVSLVVDLGFNIVSNLIFAFIVGARTSSFALVNDGAVVFELVVVVISNIADVNAPIFILASVEGHHCLVLNSTIDDPTSCNLNIMFVHHCLLVVDTVMSECPRPSFAFRDEYAVILDLVFVDLVRRCPRYPWRLEECSYGRSCRLLIGEISRDGQSSLHEWNRMVEFCPLEDN